MICPNCGAENRESAKFCSKCTHQLVELWPATVQLDESYLRARARKRKRRKHKSMLSRRWRVMLLIGAALLLLALIVWVMYPDMSSKTQHTGDVPQAAAVSVPALAPAPPAATAINPDSSLAAVAPAASISVAPANVPKAAAQSPPALVLTTAAVVVAPVVIEPASRSQPQPKNKKNVSPPSPDSAPQPSLAAALLPPPSPARTPAPPPAPAKQIALCAGTSFIAHDWCLHRECARPDLHQHPQCLRMREQQQALRAGSGDF